MKKTILIVSLLAALCASAVLMGTSAPAVVAEAAMRGDRDAVKALLKKGSDVNVPLSDGMTALHYAAALGDAQMAEMPLYAGADPKAKTRINEYTPLHVASESGSAAVVKLLLNAGADVNATQPLAVLRRSIWLQVRVMLMPSTPCWKKAPIRTQPKRNGIRRL
jgi:hypothetical protein